MIKIYPELQKSINDKPSSNFFEDIGTLLGKKVFPFSSARAALVFGLKALGFNRMDEVLVPPFLSNCVLSAISKTAFPALVPTSKTRAIYVFHQFGFPQIIEEIELKAKQNGWILVNCCVHSPFTKTNGSWLAGWGDLTILSFPKLYPCGLGGGLITNNDRILKYLDSKYTKLFLLHEKWANMAYNQLKNAKQNSTIDNYFNVEAVYGYLPDTVTFPSDSYNHLPADICSINKDIDRRIDLLKSLNDSNTEITKDIKNDEVVPFAIPLKMDSCRMDYIKKRLRLKFNVEAEVLHYDYNRNILNSNYEKALVLGCHTNWNNSIFEEIESM